MLITVATYLSVRNYTLLSPATSCYYSKNDTIVIKMQILLTDSHTLISVCWENLAPHQKMSCLLKAQQYMSTVKEEISKIFEQVSNILWWISQLLLFSTPTHAWRFTWKHTSCFWFSSSCGILFHNKTVVLAASVAHVSSPLPKEEMFTSNELYGKQVFSLLGKLQQVFSVVIHVLSLLSHTIIKFASLRSHNVCTSFFRNFIR